MEKLADISAFEAVQNQAVFNWMRYARTPKGRSGKMPKGFHSTKREAAWGIDPAADMDESDLYQTILAYDKAVSTGRYSERGAYEELQKMYGLNPKDVEYIRAIFEKSPEDAIELRKKQVF